MAEVENDIIRQLLNKIGKAFPFINDLLGQGLPEIKYGAISSLNSKLTTKLIAAKDLAEGYPELPGYLLNFINHFQTTAPKDILSKTVNIITILSKVFKFWAFVI